MNVHAQAKCIECQEIFTDSDEYEAVALHAGVLLNLDAREHAQETGHQVVAEVQISYVYDSTEDEG